MHKTQMIGKKHQCKTSWMCGVIKTKSREIITFTTNDFKTLSFNSTTHPACFTLMFLTYHLCTVYSYYSAL
jgi:hypothetical protein